MSKYTFTKLCKLGYHPIPIKPNSKLPAGGRGWNTKQYDYAALDGLHTQGIGLLCDNIVGIDIDSMDPAVAYELEAICHRELGLPRSTPVRVGRAPKRLLIVRVEAPVKSWDISQGRGKDSTIFQLLGAGKQFVVQGIHPDTGNPYTLSRALPAWSKLPPVTQASLDALRDVLAAYSDSGAPTPHLPPKTSQEPRWDDHNMNLAIDKLETLDPAMSRPEWLKVGMSLHAGTHGDQDGLELFEAWSNGSIGDRDTPDNYVEGDAAKQWKSFKIGGGISTGTLFENDFPKIALTTAPKFEKTNQEVDDPLPATGGDQYDEWPDPVNIDEFGRVIPTLPADALPPLIDAIARSAPNTYDPFALAYSILAACSMLTTDNYELAITPDWHESPRLWVGLVGASGTRKSPTLKVAMRPVRRISATLAEEYQTARLDYDREMTLKKIKKVDREAIEPRPVQSRIYTNDATIEAISEILKSKVNAHGIGIIHDELSTIIAAMDGRSDGTAALQDRGNWLKLYDGGSHQIDRIMRDVFITASWSASVAGAITTDKWKKLSRKLEADGLAARISMIEYPATVTGDEIESIPGELRDAYDELADRLVKLRVPIKRTAHFTPGAYEAFKRASKKWDAERVVMSEELPRYAERLSKLPGVLGRMALLFVIIELTTAPSGGMFTVDERAVVRASRLIDAQRLHDLNIYRMNAEGDRPPYAEIADWILRKDHEAFSIRDMESDWKAVRGWLKPRLADALTTLESLGWVGCSDDEPLTRSGKFKRGVTWRVNPKVYRANAARAAVVRAQVAELRAQLKRNIDELAQ